MNLTTPGSLLFLLGGDRSHTAVINFSLFSYSSVSWYKNEFLSATFPQSEEIPFPPYLTGDSHMTNSCLLNKHLTCPLERTEDSPSVRSTLCSLPHSCHGRTGSTSKRDAIFFF